MQIFQPHSVVQCMKQAYLDTAETLQGNFFPAEVWSTNKSNWRKQIQKKRIFLPERKGEINIQ